LVYPCFCSRKDILRAASAPHEGEEGPRYPGTCRDLTPAERAARVAAGRASALRLRTDDEPVRFDDPLQGQVALRAGGDFVVPRSDGQFGYQLAVGVDDAAMGIAEVVRGDDLVGSTPRQLLLYRSLGLVPPRRFVHLPLVLGPDGQRL